jgi:hypothetical protein
MSGHKLTEGIEVFDGTNWIPLTDDNRQPLKIVFEVIEKTNRMADGALRRYVIARKHKISTSWTSVWSKTSQTTDGGKAGAWMRSFYEANVFVPVQVRVTIASETTQNIQATSTIFQPDETTYASSANSATYTNNTYNTFITNFDYEVTKRNKDFDLVNISIEFTEI